MGAVGPVGPVVPEDPEAAGGAGADADPGEVVPLVIEELTRNLAACLLWKMTSRQGRAPHDGNALRTSI